MLDSFTFSSLNNDSDHTMGELLWQVLQVHTGQKSPGSISANHLKGLHCWYFWWSLAIQILGKKEFRVISVAFKHPWQTEWENWQIHSAWTHTYTLLLRAVVVSSRQTHTSCVWVALGVLPLQSPVPLHDALPGVARQAPILSICCNAFKTNPVRSASHWLHFPYRFSSLASFFFPLHCQLCVNKKLFLLPSRLSFPCFICLLFLCDSSPLSSSFFCWKILSAGVCFIVWEWQSPRWRTLIN